MVQRFISSIISQVVKLISGANPRWLDCRPCGTQRVYFANHTSHLDALVLWSCLSPSVRERTRPVAAKDYWEKNSVRRYLAQNVFNVVMVERPGKSLNDQMNATVAARHAMDEIIAAVQNDYSLIIFPEGTRGMGERMGKFKGGLYHIAKHCPKVELVPVYIENLNRILPKGQCLIIPLLSSITFGQPIHVLEDESKKDFLERAENAINKLREV